MRRHFTVAINTSDWPTDEIMPLLDLAYKEAKQHRPDSTIHCHVALSKTRRTHFNARWERGGRSRIAIAGRKGVFPYQMGTNVFADAHELIVYLAAWMFAGSLGISASPRRIAADALDSYRKNVDEIQAKIAKVTERKQQAVGAAFARQVFEGIEKNSFEYKMSVIRRSEKVWLRKLNLAQTKLMKLHRRRSALQAAQTRKQKQIVTL